MQRSKDPKGPRTFVVTFLTKNSKIGRKFYYLEKLNSKIGRKTYYLEKLNSKNGRKFYYSQKLCFDKFFE